MCVLCSHHMREGEGEGGRVGGREGGREGERDGGRERAKGGCSLLPSHERRGGEGNVECEKKRYG